MLKIFFTLLFFFVLFSTNLFSQNCEKKLSNHKQITGKWDFKSQSIYTQLASNDVIRIKTIVYQKYDYRIFAICESKLGKIKFKIYEPEKRFEATVDRIAEKEITTYQRDDKGFLIYDDDENPIPTGTAIVNDTIWSRTLTTVEKLIFDSSTSETFYWESRVQKTQLLIVELSIPKTRRFQFGCIGVMVGRISYANEKLENNYE